MSSFDRITPNRFRDPRLLSDDEWFDQALRIAAPPTGDDRAILAGMSRPATTEELHAVLDEEVVRLRRLHELPPAA